MKKVAVYSICMGKTGLLKQSFRGLGMHAGMEFKHYVWDQATHSTTTSLLEKKLEHDHIHYLGSKGKNVGQNIAANFLLDQIFKDMPDVDWILRYDPDAIPRSKRFLKRLVKIGDQLIEQQCLPILSPKITKLEHEPPPVYEGDDLIINEKVVKYEVVQMLGGICRLHPGPFFDGFRFNRFMPMGLGEAAEVADRVTFLAQNQIPWVTLRIPELKVEHALGHSGQGRRYPKDFGFEYEMRRKVGYGL